MLASVGNILVEGHAPISRSASEGACEVIRQAILDGRLPPGGRLKEEELAQELGISRTPVREALLMLQAEGLVDAAPNRGATVRSHSVEDLTDLYQLRALLEGYAARRAAAGLSDDAIAALRESCDRFERLLGDDEDMTGLVKENLFFHQTILEGAGSARLGTMVRQVIELPLVYRSYVWYSPGAAADLGPLPFSDHAGARGARLRARELVMKEHIFEARDLLLRHWRELEAGGVTETVTGAARGRHETEGPGPLAGVRVARARDAARRAVCGSPARRHGRRDHQGRAAGPARPAA